MATVSDRLKSIVVEQLGVDENEVVPSARFVNDLGADSLDLVELIMSIEEVFSTPEKKITIPDEKAEKIVTVQDAIDYLADLGITDQGLPTSALKGKPADTPKDKPVDTSEDK
jgi:acyl carrier protein